MEAIETIGGSAGRALRRIVGRYAFALAVVGLALSLAPVAYAAGSGVRESRNLGSTMWAGQATPLEATPWTLVSYAGPDGATQPVLPGTEVTASFEAGRLSGSAGCNAYTGTYRLSDSALTLAGVANTQRLCGAPPGIMEQEAAYLAALARAAQADMTPGALTLRDRDGALLLTFAPQAQTPLEGTPWTAQAYNNGRGGVVTILTGTAITARFAEGRIAGSAGCNSYSAPYTLNGNAIEIGPAISTRMACAAPPGIMEQETAYLAALATARAYRTEGRQLILETADGARVASFVPADASRAPDGSASAGAESAAKITFDLAPIDDAGLTGPPEGRVAVAYEFCIPATPAHLVAVQRIDPTMQAQAGARGRMGCRPGDETLCLGSTHQPGWRSVLDQLAALEYVARIDRSFAE